MGKRKSAGITIVPASTAPPAAPPSTVEAIAPPPAAFEATFVPGIDGPAVPGIDGPAVPKAPPLPPQRPRPEVWQAEIVLELPADISAALQASPREAEQLATDLIELLPPSVTVELGMYGGKLTMRLPESMHDLLRRCYCHEDHRTRRKNGPVQKV